MPRVYQCIRSHYVVSVKPKHSIRVYLCPSVAQKTKLRKLTERQRKQAIWPRMDTDTHGCGVPAKLGRQEPPGFLQEGGSPLRLRAFAVNSALQIQGGPSRVCCLTDTLNRGDAETPRVFP